MMAWSAALVHSPDGGVVVVAHCPFASHVDPLSGQVPQVAPQPSEPHTFPSHCGVHAVVSGVGCAVSGVGTAVSGVGTAVSGVGTAVSGVGCVVSGAGVPVSDFGSGSLDPLQAMSAREITSTAAFFIVLSFFLSP